MSDQIMPPAKSPCGSCPYRRDVPSGVWSADEYAKLPEFDKPTWEQPPAVFLCHQQDGRMCGGWTAVHDMDNSLGLRMAQAIGLMSPETAQAALNYETATPLFSSGTEAAEHGLAEIDTPSERAQRVVGKLAKKPGVTRS